MHGLLDEEALGRRTDAGFRVGLRRCQPKREQAHIHGLRGEATAGLNGLEASPPPQTAFVPAPSFTCACQNKASHGNSTSYVVINEIGQLACKVSAPRHARCACARTSCDYDISPRCFVEHKTTPGRDPPGSCHVRRAFDVQGSACDKKHISIPFEASAWVSNTCDVLLTASD